MSTIDPPKDEQCPIAAAVKDGNSEKTEASQTDHQKSWKSRLHAFLGPANDTKTIFDSLRNMGICVAMLLGLSTLSAATANFICPTIQFIIGFAVIVLSALLVLINLAWTFRTFEVKSRPFANWTLIFFAVYIYAAFANSAWQQLPSP